MHATKAPKSIRDRAGWRHCRQALADRAKYTVFVLGRPGRDPVWSPRRSANVGRGTEPYMSFRVSSRSPSPSPVYIPVRFSINKTAFLCHHVLLSFDKYRFFLEHVYFILLLLVWSTYEYTLLFFAYKSIAKKNLSRDWLVSAIV
jgi:hypothetical protein